MNYTITTLDQLRPILLGFRKSRGLTQAGLAAKLGIAQQTYAQLEANPTSVSVERLFRLLRVLGVELVLADAANEPSAKVQRADKARPFLAEKALGKEKSVTPALVPASRQEVATSRKTLVKSLDRVSKVADNNLASGRPRSQQKKREIW